MIVREEVMETKDGSAGVARTVGRCFDRMERR